MITRRTLLSAAAATAALGWRATARAGASQGDATRKSLAAATEYLWRQQGDDGGWHSPQYGVLRSGQALTPFVLDAPLRVPEATASRTKGGVDRAVACPSRRPDA